MDWNFGDLLDVTAAAVPPQRPALIYGERIISWTEFDVRTNRLARAMLAAGLKTGDRVAILARNIPEFIEIAAATFKARLTHVNINYRYTTAEMEYVLADCTASALFFQEEFTDTVAPLCASLAHLQLCVCIGRATPPTRSYTTLTDNGDGSPLAFERSPDDGYLLYTGGTTGRPKGVMWRAADARAIQLESPMVKTAITTMAEHVAAVANNPLPGRVIPACPLMHGAGLNSSMAELVNGGTVILLQSQRFDAAELWSEAERHRATRVLIVGDVFARPLAQALEAEPQRWDLSALRLISSAGLMWSEQVKAMLVRHLPQVTLLDILGASEASGFGYAITNSERSTPTGWFEPGPNTVLIDVETQRVLNPDEVGQGWLARRPPFAQGYYGDEQKTRESYPVIDGQRYAVPGDVAARDAQGRIQLIGRGSMCINTGGEKVFAEEVEEALKRAVGVEDALVAGVPDATWGSAVAALLRVSDAYSEAATRQFLLTQLAAYKIPKHLFICAEMPRHASGKSDYRRARELLEARL